MVKFVKTSGKHIEEVDWMWTLKKMKEKEYQLNKWSGKINNIKNGKNIWMTRFKFKVNKKNKTNKRGNNGKKIAIIKESEIASIKEMRKS